MLVFGNYTSEVHFIGKNDLDVYLGLRTQHQLLGGTCILY